MRKRIVRVSSVRAAKRFIAALVGMPAIAFILAIIFPSQAYADNTQSDQGGAGQNTNVGSSASSEVVQQDPSVVSAQGTVTGASTAVATAESAVTTLETKVTQLTEVASSLSQPAQEVTTAVQSATNSVTTANAATESAATAVSTAQTAIATSQTANQTLAQATASVATQVAVVTEAQTTLTQASTAVDSQEAIVTSAQTTATQTQAAASTANTTTTVTETFTNFANNSSSVVTVATGPGISVGGNWNTPQTSGSGLIIQFPTNNVVIDVNPSNTGTVTSVTMGVYAKNGDTTMTATNTDGSTTTTVIENNVTPALQSVSYTTTETITGSSIETLTIVKDSDYYIIDNIAVTKTSSDPALTAAAQQAAATLSTEQATLTTLQTAETTATTTLSTAQGTLSTLQTAESTAQTAATTATTTMQTAATIALSSAETATSSVAEAVVIVAVAQVVVSSAAIETASAALETVVTTSDGLPLQKPEIIAVVDAAVDAVVEAQEAIATATTSMQTAETLAETAPTVQAATAVVEDKTQVLQQAQAAVDAQEVVVAQATSAEAAAQAVVDAATTPGLKVEVYNVQGQNNAPVLPANAIPILTTTDTNGINEQWGGGPVAGTNRSEDVIVKYSGQLTAPITGTISLHAPADDGVKVILDGNTVINDWFDKGGGGSTRTYSVVANDPMDFTLWYYENGGGAWVQFYWNLGSGNIIVPGSAFTQSGATSEQLSTLATAEATLIQEQNELEVLDLAEDVAQQNLLGAQQNLVVAQTAVTAMETAVVDAQTAITKTIEAITAVQTAQTIVQQEVVLQSPIEAPTNIVVTQLENGDVQVSWDPPSGIISPERYAVSWSVGGSGWGIATGNAGDENALNTTIVLSASLFESTGGLDATYQISVRSDNDSLAKYSQTTSTEILIADLSPPPPPPPPNPDPEPTPVDPIPEPPTPVEPPAEEPPAEEPPAEEPPAEEPPAEEPPAEEPPAEEPPAEEPTQEEVVDTAVEDAIDDGKLTSADAEKILDALNADGKVTSDEVNNLSDALAADGKLTEAEKDLVADALIQSVAPGETLTKEQIQDAGIEYKDLPAETPVEVRQDENGNEVVITAEVAAALEVLANPVELLSTVFSDPAQALLALGSIGADMSDEERKESTEAVVATVIAAGAAINAVAAAAGGAAGSSSGTGSGGGGNSGGGAPSGDSKGVRRRKP